MNIAAICVCLCVRVFSCLFSLINIENNLNRKKVKRYQRETITERQDKQI